MHGPRGEGTLRVVARKRHERWTFESAVFGDGAARDRIDLLSNPPMN